MAMKAADLRALMAVMGKMTGSSFHEPSAADARARIIDFFDQHLKG